MICNALCGYKLGRAWFNIPRLAAIKHFAWLRKSHKLGGKKPIGLEMAMAAIFSSQSWVRIHRHVPPKATRSVTYLSLRRLSVWAPKRWPMGSQLLLPFGVWRCFYGIRWDIMGYKQQFSTWLCLKMGYTSIPSIMAMLIVEKWW